MDKLKFIQAITRLRVLEKRLLDKIKLERMIDSPNAESSLKLLLDNNYGKQSMVNKPEDYEILLNEELKALYDLMYEVSPEPLLIDIMAIKYDYHNIKVLLKAKALKKDLNHLLSNIGTISTVELNEYITTEKYKGLSLTMAEAIKAAESEYNKSEDPQIIDIIVDKFQYKEMLEKAIQLGDSYAIDFIKMLIDFINIKAFIRICRQNKDRNFLSQVLIEGGTVELSTLMSLQNEQIDNLATKLSSTKYGKILKEGIEAYAKSGSISYLEKLMDNELMDYVKKGKYVTFGIEPLFSYLVAKETEIRDVRIIMVGKLNQIAPAVIRERLRDIYV